MKWIFGLLILSILFSSCDNELVVTDEWKDIPVVWGLLNKSDTAHYIRVEKAFLDPTTSALDIARIPDSLYYDNATVSLKRVNTGQVFMLQRVDGIAEGYPREPGIFAESPNYLYKIKANVINLVIGEKYEFILDKGDGSTPVTAQTIILPRPELRNPPVGSLLAFRRNNSYTFTWNAIPDAGIFDLKLRFYYKETILDSGIVNAPKSFEWDIATNIPDNEYTLSNGIEFFNTVKANVPAKLGAIRNFDSVEIIIWAGGVELANFIKLAKANTGITSTQDIPVYTNLSEGLGIFSSRNVSYNPGFQLAPQTLDSLKAGSVTKTLNFK
jgi:hypothetical protein